MPIVKDGDGQIVYSPKSEKFKTELTGTHPSGSFQIADDLDQLKQLNFDLTPMATNSRVKFKLQNPSVNSEVTITFPNTDTTLGAGGSANSFATIQPDSGTAPTATGPTDVLTLTSANGYLTVVGNATTDTITFTVTGLEPALGNPSSNGYVLSSTTSGTRSWVANGGGGGGSPGGSDTQVQYNDAGSFAGDSAFTFIKASKILEMPSSYASGNPGIRLRDSSAGWLSGNSALDLSHSDGSGLSSVVAYNGAGLRLQASNASAGTNFGQIVINNAAATVSSAQASRSVLVVKHAASATGDYMSVQGSANTNPAFVIKPASSGNASARIGIQSDSAGLSSFTPSAPLEMAIERYVNTDAFLIRTTDGSVGAGTGFFRVHPASDSGLGLFEFANNAGANFEFKNGDGSSFFSLWKANSNGLQLRSGNTARIPVIIKGESSHSSNLLEVRNSSDTNMVSVDPSGNVSLNVAGQGLKVKEGTNATMGVATLVGGTVTVSTTKVTANSRIFLTRQNASGTIGSPGISARSAGTSFTITSTNILDTSDVAWLIMEPS